MTSMKRKLTREEATKRAEKFSERYVARGPYEFFPEPEVVKVVQEGLGENEMEQGYRYCP
jgi:ferredoxin-thioredoxin reductase catalytic subunit